MISLITTSARTDGSNNVQRVNAVNSRKRGDGRRVTGVVPYSPAVSPRSTDKPAGASLAVNRISAETVRTDAHILLERGDAFR